MATESQLQSISNRINDLRAFDETKAGVKGLVDGGITTVPQMFLHPPENLGCLNTTAKATVPTIDLNGVGSDPIRHKQVVAQIREAAELWGFFRIINHGVMRDVLDDVIEGTRRFHEQEVEVKAQYYTRDNSKGLAYCSNFHLYRLPEAEWRDMFSCSMAPDKPNPDDLPVVCREILIKYSKQVKELGQLLFKLLSEGLGLDENHLLDIGCHEGLILIGHYYPPCPEPELTLGIRKHSDNNFMTILLQDHNIGGLQVMHENQWVDVEPIPGSLVVNIGNILQIISNDKFKSVEHRVLANSVGPRISMAGFFSTGRNSSQRAYGPIEDLLSKDNPPRYPAITQNEFFTSYIANASDGIATLRHLRLK